jgi:hypothetical protein
MPYRVSRSRSPPTETQQPRFDRKHSEKQKRTDLDFSIWSHATLNGRKGVRLTAIGKEILQQDSETGPGDFCRFSFTIGRDPPWRTTRQVDFGPQRGKMAHASQARALAGD